MSELIDKAVEWIEGDPDPETRQELQSIIDAGDLLELDSRMVGSLTFGTAGIRGEVGAGPNRMNRAVVIRTTRGLAGHLLRHGDAGRPVIVGFDARPSSRQFAEDTCGVLAAAGIPVLYFPDFAPTPLVAYAAKHLGAAAAVVVTASHNPPRDNGYKVYSENSAQIIPPEDAEIAAEIAEVGPAASVPRVEAAFEADSDLISKVSVSIVDCYWDEVDSWRPEPTSSDLRIVYTPIHGVGGELLKDLFARAGHGGLIPVPLQFEPDGTFPTVAFPNPEEKGALDLAIALAEEREADVVIANDPDADRMAAVIPSAGEWRPLTGNEMGVLLGDYLLRNAAPEPVPIVVSSIVSSPMLGELARLRGARHETTLTGFKWIVNAGLALERGGDGRFVFGYEEALGYTIGSTVRDKDGISAALVFCDMIAGLRRRGVTVLDRLAELWAKAGLWVSAQHSIVRPSGQGSPTIASAIADLAANPPSRVGGIGVVDVTDYGVGAERRPPWLGEQSLVELTLADAAGRVLVRPSGTEPKLKIYVDLREDVSGDPHEQQRESASAARTVAEAMAAELEL